MKYTAVLNGSSGQWPSKSHEMDAFLSASMTKNDTADTLWFYTIGSNKEELTANSPTEAVRLARVTRYQPENGIEILARLHRDDPSDIYIFPDDMFGREMSVRSAFRMHGSSLMSVRGIAPSHEGILCRKWVYASHVQAVFRMNAKPFCMTAAKGCAEDIPVSQRTHRIISDLDCTDLTAGDFVQRYELKEENSDTGIEQSKFLVIAGRGCKNKKTVEKIAAIAEAMGADYGVSRPAAMSAWAPMDRLVGVSGAMTGPDICITVGVSGSAAFLAGIEKSKFIISVNTDESAPISKCSDVMIVDDGEQVLEEILLQYNSAKGKV
ncbi:MAG: FAD-binding protein [Eubacteriales bacterium]